MQDGNMRVAKASRHLKELVESEGQKMAGSLEVQRPIEDNELLMASSSRPITN